MRLFCKPDNIYKHKLDFTYIKVLEFICKLINIHQHVFNDNPLVISVIASIFENHPNGFQSNDRQKLHIFYYFDNSQENNRNKPSCLHKIAKRNTLLCLNT